MTKIEECENCGAKEETVKGYSVWIKKSGTGAMFKLCPKCVRLAKEDKLPFRIIDRSYIKREEKVEERPKICPLLAIAKAHVRLATRKDFQCIKDECGFYLEKLPKKMEKCVFVRLALSLGMIAERKPTSFLEQRLKRRMQNLKKQQSP